MSLTLAREELKRFLAADGPSVFCLTGSWGIGKTYNWGSVLTANEAVIPQRFTHYSYVSLFGIEDLEKAKLAVFENGRPRTRIDDRKSSNVIQWFKDGGWRKLIQLPSKLPKVNEWVPDISQYAFALVDSYIVCFDDLERKSDKLGMKDLLGLVSLLKEQRQCKVVIILNSDALDGSTEDFQRYFEKVVDVRLELNPTPEECADIGASGTSAVTALVHRNSVSLGIRNIRVISKVRRFCERLAETLKDSDAAVLEDSIRSATLIGWALYEPDTAPSLDFLQSRTIYTLSEKRDPTPKETEWAELLSNYKFGHFGELDRIILNGLRMGYLDEAGLKGLALEAEDYSARIRVREPFRAMWREFHQQFREDPTFATRLGDAAKEAASEMQASDLNVTVLLLRKLGERAKATEVIDAVVNGRPAGSAYFDLENSSFGGEVTDPEVRKAFAARLGTSVDTRSVTDVLEQMVSNSGWNERDTFRLLALSQKSYTDSLKSYSGDALVPMVKRGLSFRQEAGRESIGNKVEAALRALAKEGPVNKARARKFGVDPTKPAKPKTAK